MNTNGDVGAAVSSYIHTELPPMHSPLLPLDVPTVACKAVIATHRHRAILWTATFCNECVCWWSLVLFLFSLSLCFHDSTELSWRTSLSLNLGFFFFSVPSKYRWLCPVSSSNLLEILTNFTVSMFPCLLAFSIWRWCHLLARLLWEPRCAFCPSFSPEVCKYHHPVQGRFLVFLSCLLFLKDNSSIYLSMYLSIWKPGLQKWEGSACG